MIYVWRPHPFACQCSCVTPLNEGEKPYCPLYRKKKLSSLFSVPFRFLHLHMPVHRMDKLGRFGQVSNRFGGLLLLHRQESWQGCMTKLKSPSSRTCNTTLPHQFRHPNTIFDSPWSAIHTTKMDGCGSIWFWPGMASGGSTEIALWRSAKRC